MSDEDLLAGKRIVLGICGGIAAYKAAELARLLVRRGARVQVVLTRSAEQFVTRLTLQTLTGNPVGGELFDLDEESRIGHIRLADEAELLLVAPATAHTLARLALGLADDLLGAVALVTRAPLLLAPAMNVHMWQHPQTQEHVARLRQRGAQLVGPEAGELACGWVGAGRMAEPVDIVRACERALGPRDLEGVPLLVTAGPTQEAVDPVRYLGNRSSGKMGFAIARRAARRGARVTLVAGPVALETPAGVERVDVRSAVEMREAVLRREGEVRCIVKAAAVADFRPVSRAAHKLKKEDGVETMTLVLERNPDILAELGQRRRARGGGAPLLIGFAAETDALERHAQEKLAKKGCDLIVANDVSERGTGFGGEDNQVVLFAPGEEPERWPLLPKDEVADRLLDRVLRMLVHSPASCGAPQASSAGPQGRGPV